MKITKEESGIISMVRLNRLWKIQEINRSWHIGKTKITFRWRSKDNLWGRFGGGWNWKLGFQAGGKTLILDILIASLRIEYVEVK